MFLYNEDITGRRVMKTLTGLTKKRLKNNAGATVVEYALFAGIIGIAVAGTIFLMGDRISDIFQIINSAFTEIVT